MQVLFRRLAVSLTLSLCVCSGNTPTTKGRAFVIYEDIHDAMNACERLAGFNVKDRYISVTYHKVEAVKKPTDVEERRKQLEALKQQHNVDASDDA